MKQIIHHACEFFLYMRVKYMRVKSRVCITEILNQHALRDSQRNLKKKK